MLLYISIHIIYICVCIYVLVVAVCCRWVFSADFLFSMWNMWASHRISYLLLVSAATNWPKVTYARSTPSSTPSGLSRQPQTLRIKRLRAQAKYIWRFSTVIQNLIKLANMGYMQIYKERKKERSRSGIIELHNTTSRYINSIYKILLFYSQRNLKIYEWCGIGNHF